MAKTTNRLLLLLVVLLIFFQTCNPKKNKNKWIKFNFSYRVEVPPQNSTKNIRIWIPYPAQNEVQEVVDMKINSPIKWRITREQRHGNRMLFFNGRIGTKPLKLNIDYQINRRVDNGIPIDQISKSKYNDPGKYIGPNKYLPDIPLFQDLAKSILSGASGKNLSKDRRAGLMYRYVINSMHYDKSGKGWGKGDAIWACINKKGNCTDFHSLFIALVRTQKIPARFHIGFPVKMDDKKNEIFGYHCWAEFYSDQKGWIPLDATEGKKSGKPFDFFGTIPANRIQFAQGRDITLNPVQKGEPLNYFIYPYIEINGKVLKAYKKQFFVTAKKKSDRFLSKK